MKVAVPVLAPILRSDVQGRLLADILADPATERTVTDLARRAGTSLPTALRELDRAEAARLVVSRRLGNTRLVRAEPTNPLYEPVRTIVLATYGAPAVIAGELSGIDGIDHAYLFGSWAARYLGQPGPAPNDIDLLVIGHPDRYAVYDAAERAEQRLEIPVQATIRSPHAWVDTTDAFIAEVRSRPLVAIRPEQP